MEGFVRGVPSSHRYQELGTDILFFLQVVKSLKRNFHIYENILEAHRLKKEILSLSLYIPVGCVCVYIYVCMYVCGTLYELSLGDQ